MKPFEGNDEVHHYSIQDQIRVFGLMQNWLGDNTTYMDKLFTFQIMCLMAEKSPSELTASFGRSYMNLEDYYTFDNEFKFYRFEEECCIDMRHPEMKMTV